MNCIRYCLFFFSLFVIHGLGLSAAPIEQAHIKLSVGQELQPCNHKLRQCLINVSRNSTQCLPTPGSITVKNNSLINANNISASSSDYNFNNFIVQNNGCPASLPPNQSCSITFYTNSSVSFLITNVMIKGTNTNVSYFDMQAIPCSEATITSVAPTSGAAAGGTAVTLMGTLLTGATSVTFGGNAATSVNVINPTTITAVTPAHAVGIVDVVVNTPSGPATLANGYTYLTTAVGQPSGGGTIACLNGAPYENLIAANINQPINIQTIWGPTGPPTMTDDFDGATNTTTIVGALGNFQSGNYPAYKCDNYEIDSQGNTPCQAGNECYTDWFLTANEQLNCLYNNRVVVGGFISTGYWTSTATSANNARYQDFGSGTRNTIGKNNTNVEIKCVRNVTP